MFIHKITNRPNCFAKLFGSVSQVSPFKAKKNYKKVKYFLIALRSLVIALLY